MIRVPHLFALALMTTMVAQAPIPMLPTSMHQEPVVPDAARPIDLVICLDISGSMDGLINAARQNLWAVVNDMATLQPAPTLRVALLTYGCTTHDAERGWVKVETGFTTDLDLVSEKLFALTTNGGDEYVARVVHAALGELDWSRDPQALKLMFVAGNEAATQDPKFDSITEAKAAIAREILVNTIFCGSEADPVAPGWRDVATAADGKFAVIDHDSAVVITTPFDSQLTALSEQINTTYVVYGREGARAASNQVAQDSNAASLNVAAAAQRCQTKAGSLYVNPAWDLVDACKQADFDLTKIKKDDLPEALRGMTTEQLRAHVAEQGAKRAAMQQQAAELGKQRDAYVLEAQKKLSASGQKVFEQAVLESVREQAESRGFHRKVEPPKDTIDPKFAPIVEAAARDYQKFSCVTGSPKVAPAACRIPGPYARMSAAEKQHGGKLYLLYARFADGLEYVTPGQTEKVGQTLVKEAWQCVAGKPTGPTEATARYPFGLTMREAGADYHAGDAYGLFVMHKLAADTPGTDQGWVYGTIDKHGVVTGAGRMTSCMHCHESATEDRRFGLR